MSLLFVFAHFLWIGYLLGDGNAVEFNFRIDYIQYAVMKRLPANEDKGSGETIPKRRHAALPILPKHIFFLTS